MLQSSKMSKTNGLFFGGGMSQMGSPAILRDRGWDQASGQETIAFFIELCLSVLKRANALIFFYSDSGTQSYEGNQYLTCN